MLEWRQPSITRVVFVRSSKYYGENKYGSIKCASSEMSVQNTHTHTHTHTHAHTHTHRTHTHTSHTPHEWMHLRLQCRLTAGMRPLLTRAQALRAPCASAELAGGRALLL